MKIRNLIPLVYITKHRNKSKMKLKRTQTLTTPTLDNTNNLEIKFPAVGKANKRHEVHFVGRVTSVGISTRYGLVRSGDLIPVGGGAQIFRTRPDRPWGPPTFLYNWYRVFPEGQSCRVPGVEHPQPIYRRG
jgi:hypothetical protein